MLDSKWSQTLGRVALYEEQDSGQSLALRRVALGARPDPSRTDYGEAYPELTFSGRASTHRAGFAEAEIAKASKV